jgi:hypothetical protein
MNITAIALGVCLVMVATMFVLIGGGSNSSQTSPLAAFNSVSARLAAKTQSDEDLPARWQSTPKAEQTAASIASPRSDGPTLAAVLDDPDITEADRGVERAKAAVSAILATKSSNVNTLVRAANGGYKFPPIAGQVTVDTHFGALLYKLASEPDTRLVLEIGTWNGGGSSLCIGKGLKDSGSGFLFTMEAVEDQWIQAGNTLRDYPVKTILGSAVEASSISGVDEIMQGGGLPNIDPAEWQKWWAGEKQLAESYLVPHLRELCKRIPFDMILLDGAEFFGPSEWRETLRHCHHAKYIGLHDTAMWKNRKPKAAMLANTTHWKLVGDETSIR